MEDDIMENENKEKNKFEKQAEEFEKTFGSKGDGVTFEDVENIRRRLYKMELESYYKAEAINEKSTEMAMKKSQDMDMLALKRLNLLKDWEFHIKHVLTKEDEANINRKYLKKEEEIQQMRETQALNKIKRKNLERKLTNRITYAAILWMAR